MLVKHDDENLTKIVGVNNGETVGRPENDPLIGKQGIHCRLIHQAHTVFTYQHFLPYL